ncbi:MAG: energy-coupling factor ABC transporter permease [Spirochaetia bacterium]|jgi:cobalt/nickel transport system permease protein|nr:energy-coupling factor ABC transporter permease [Spirochaetia bacterium]
MHMADALISPVVGATMWGASIMTVSYSIKKTKIDIQDKNIPLMGIMAAFVFASQMINFSIPGTGSSGHLGGGLILAAILGPYAGFIAMSSVLAIQALFFADGGLLAYGCNVINLGFFSCFVAYPLLYKTIARDGTSRSRNYVAALVAAIGGLQLGSLAVVFETLLSGKTELPFGTFLALMQPIHLAIGIVEGFVSAAVIAFIQSSAPSMLYSSATNTSTHSIEARLSGIPKKTITGLVVATLLMGGILSWFASSNPDGLEWALGKTAGVEELEATGSTYDAASSIQDATAFLPDYGFKAPQKASPGVDLHIEPANTWPAIDGGTSLSGIVGGAMTLGLSALAGVIIVLLRRKGSSA